MEKNLTNRDKQAIATKKKIYKVGVDLIRKHGFDGIKVSQIAKSAGVSVGTFYHYYTSKLDLFMDLYRTADTYYEEQVAKKMDNLTFSERVQLFFREYAAIAEDNGVDLIRKMYVPDNSLFLARSDGMHQVLLDIISAGGTELPVLAEKTPREIADDLFLIARGVIFDWALRGGEYDLKEKMNAMLGIYLKQ